MFIFPSELPLKQGLKTLNLKEIYIILIRIVYIFYSCPENCYENDYSKQHVDVEQGMSMYNTPHVRSWVKIGKHKVTLRPHWRRNRRWKKQFIIEGDVDDFSNEFIKNIK